MVRYLISGIALAVLAACQPGIPDSRAASQRDATLAGAPAQSALPAAAPVTAAPLDSSPSDPAMRPLPSAVTSAVTGQTTPAAPAGEWQSADASTGAAPLQPNQLPEAVSGTGISAEQDFDAVSATRTIETDAQKIAANRAQYTLVEPTELPDRPGTNQPNIVEYALRTDHPLGTPLYRRVSLRSAGQHAQACARFASPDQAQTEFLSRGGPERDRSGLDPDGDGFACDWDPTPFRKARNAVAEPVGDEGDEGAAAIVDPLAISSE